MSKEVEVIQASPRSIYSLGSLIQVIEQEIFRLSSISYIRTAKEKARALSLALKRACNENIIDPEEFLSKRINGPSISEVMDERGYYGFA